MSPFSVEDVVAHSVPSNIASASWAIDLLPGLADDDAARLLDRDIHTTLDLLKLGNTQDQRNRLATELQVPIRQLNKWVALADLARIPSVGCEYAGLLLHAGLASPSQLAQSSIGQLHRQLLRLHVSTMQRRDLCPTTDAIGLWIQQARLLR